MYALPCSCGHVLEVSPGQAGDRLPCPECHQEVVVPLLRDLRQLPRVEQAGEASGGTKPASGGSFATRLLFGLAGFVALAAAGFATFALFSAMAVEVGSSTEEHIERDREILLQASPGDLVESWTEIAKTPMTERFPYYYQQQAFKKAGWQRLMISGYAVAGLAIFVAVVLGVYDRRKSSG
ncbi:hypothetical protein [Roseimaritima ulvae]|uniref:Uncharacterized protein n=1 Tax=Roseimaritima ulvae TaxID=980254 RepID=A0A5B9QXR5_9BACT|nr:hypothetical protein [Roseimaritima ulvae]QEG43854.1 hypothetical protein UC8_59110 [Roseimaritima ulvae]